MNRHVYRQTDRQSDTGTWAHRQPGTQADRWTTRQTGTQADRLILIY